MFKPEQVGKRTRYTYAKIDEVLEMPHLLDVQRKSYEWFLESGLQNIFDDISPIKDNSGNLVLSFEGFSLGEPKYDINECKNRDATYAAPLRVNVRLINNDPENQDIKEQEVFMGDFPLMTETGTFIINGAERVIVSQLVRSPGVYYTREIDTMGNRLYGSTVIPNRGAWIELETDANEMVAVRIDRNRKLPATVLIRALGWSTDESILELFWNGEVDEDGNRLYDERLVRTLEKDTTESAEEALVEIYKKLRPGEPPTVESARNLFDNLFFDPRRYDLARVGRYKLNKKLGWRQRMLGQTLAQPIVNMETGEVIVDAGTVMNEEQLDIVADSGVFNGEGFAEFYVKNADGTSFKVICNNCNLPFEHRTVTREDMIANISYLLNLMDGVGHVDDIDHLGNRRLRCVGELLQNQFRIGLTRMERVVRERMTIQDNAMITPQALINIRPVVAAIKEFFGSSQLSQFMDQTNPLGELTHKRRLSALGPGGLSRERAGFEVRDVHHSHYGRMCPIETPEGPNIGLISSLSNYAKVNEFGFIEAPYRRVEKIYGTGADANKIVKVQVTEQVVYMTADEEEGMTIAQANSILDAEGCFVDAHIACRRGHEVLEVVPEKVDYMDVSPKEVVSIGTAMIPFLENDDANRALMGANMQRQAVPLLRAQAPLVGTGMEYKAACDSGVCVLAKEEGVVTRCWGNEIHVMRDNGRVDIYKLNKFLRSNQSTCFNQKPIVFRGDRVVKGQVLADGPATDGGELALGFNVLVAFMPWEGYNYEDAILLSEELCKEDIYTSIHIEEYECDARDTKLGAEEITRELPNTGDDNLRNLDEDGIICIGAEVHPGDILVGKVTPKGETELTPEERLLRAIFGDKEREVRDTSLRVPHGESGKIVDVKVFTRENGDELQPGVNKLVRVYIAQKRKIHEGDKMAGRHGNKGVVSRVMRQEDMPFLPDGTPVQIVLNPLGVPSRMNIGQVLETHLGWAVQGLGMQIKATDLKIQNVLNQAKADSRYWDNIDRIKELYAEMESLQAKVAENVTISHLDVDSEIDARREEALGLIYEEAQKQLNTLGGRARYDELRALEKSYSDAEIEYFDDEEQAPEMEESLQEELKQISVVVDIIDAIETAREKREEIRKDLESYGYDYATYGMPKPDVAGIHIATPVFDGAHESDVFNTLRIAGKEDDGKTVLYDGRTGEPMDNKVTVGYVYMLKLHHLVDDKIHARSTGPYSLVTQQPLGGKAQFGGQRFGEMEVWALEAYGAAYTLQELLTVKSDDVVGRVKAYEKIVKGENIPEPGVPESFKVLLKELQSIGLDVKILNEDQEEVVIKELDDDDDVDTNEDEIKEVMEGSDTTSTEGELPDVEESEPVTSGEDDDVLSAMAAYGDESDTDED
ncbi:DNA-directed RNA polymerase subunit beta [Veillonella sp. R32]|uniref:DNA-directed RNA polymerase subunit beta n=1 Tax=Veillonella sp. R32 TaxID=2021312 RepID=UPI001389D755|nr:DNA-directed RNA polymerase subunit beta [Veillonella sp. R32]KAF1681862.1 DNA-directed RNA polymerase subunit beta [Veillonella sp. R32]